MARIPENDYTGQINAGNDDYPSGSARDVTTPGDGLGTPVKQTWLNDFWGFFQGILKSANITPSGNTDTVLVSQYRDALNIIAQTNRIILKNDIGNQNTHLTAQTGSVWDSSNSYPMPNLADFTKRANAGWAVGNNNGGLPGTVPLPTDGWLHFFVIRKADGTIDFGWDDQLNASKLLFASGFTYYKRLGSTYFDGSQNIRQFYQIGSDFFWTSAPADFVKSDPVPIIATPIVLKCPPDVITNIKLMNYIEYVNVITAELGLIIQSITTTQEYETLTITSDNSINRITSGYFEILSSLDSKINYRVSATTTAITLTFSTLGYKEYF